MIDATRPITEARILVGEAVCAAIHARETAGNPVSVALTIAGEPRMPADEDAAYVTLDAKRREDGAFVSRIALKIDGFPLSCEGPVRDKETLRVAESVTRWLRRIDH